MAKVKVRRASRDELPGLCLLRESIAGPMGLGSGGDGPLDLDMEIDPILEHLISHDPDGLLTVVDKQETLGFAAAHIRSRQCVVSELWVLPQHRGRGAGEALLTTCLSYGERSGAREYLALASTDCGAQSLLLRHGFEPLTPVFRFTLGAAEATRIGSGLGRLLEGHEVTEDLLALRGQADIERIDRFTRGAVSAVDQTFWLKKRECKVAFVRQGGRITGYGFASADSVGPVAGSTQEAALAALGWALSLTARQASGNAIAVWVPAPFVPAVEALLEGGGRLTATTILYARNAKLALDRWVPASPRLP